MKTLSERGFYGAKIKPCYGRSHKERPISSNESIIGRIGKASETSASLRLVESGLMYWTGFNLMVVGIPIRVATQKHMDIRDRKSALACLPAIRDSGGL